MFRRMLFAAALGLASAAPAPAAAQGWIEIERPNRPIVGPSPVVRLSSTVRARVEGRVATFEVEEQFRNTGGWVAEGTYLYPLPGEAVFTGFSLWMGETELRGEMMNAEQARGIYEEIVRRLRDPALLELAGHGLIRARVFPIQPGETRRVVLRYTQLLSRNGDALRMRYAIGSREVGSGRGMLDQPEGLRDAFRFRVTAPNAEQYGTPYSPTHGISSRRNGDDLVITLDSAATGDVELFIPLRRGLVGTSVLAHAPGGEDGFFMLLVAPPHDVESSAVPRDLTLVMDVSGSMSGDKIEQARAALRQALGTLRPADRFRVIAFSNRVTHFRETYVGATRDNLDAARAFVDRLVADGGTNIAAALEAALSGQSADGRLPIVVFATDGLPSVGEQAPERIAQNAGAEIGRARIFTVGVGTDVNTYLLDRLAQEGRGTAEYVAPEASVETAMGSLLAKIQHPALVNLRIENAPLELTLTYPSRLPDLFYGQELVVFGRYRGETRGEIVVVGERNGRAERFTAQAVFPASETDNEFIPRLWAARRIGELTRQIRIEGATPTLMEEVRQLGLRYGILTEYTSYLVQEPTAITTVLPRPPRPNEAPAPALRGGAGAARLQTGREAFERSRASSAMSGVGSLAGADATAGQRLEELAGPARRNLRRVGGRIFVELTGVWTDASHQDSLRVVEVAPFSPAYFQLVGQLPELGSWLRAGEQVLIAGRRVSIKVSPGGLTTWRQGQLDSVVRAFRGAQRAGGA